MPSDLPSTPQSDGGGSYVRAGIVMLLVAAALVAGWYFYPSPKREPQPAASTGGANTGQTKIVAPIPPPPPPPEDEPSASASVSPVASSKSTRASGGCSGDCAGEVSIELRSYLSGRASQGRKCYERALLQNSSLKGHMKVKLRLNPQGQLCNASVAADELQDPGLSQCILQLFRNSVYPSPKGGCVDVAVPLSFVPQH